MKVEKREQYAIGDKIKFVDVFPVDDDHSYDEGEKMMNWQGKIATVFKTASDFPSWMIEDDDVDINGVLINEDVNERDSNFMISLLMCEGHKEEEVNYFRHWYWTNDLIEGVVVEE